MDVEKIKKINEMTKTLKEHGMIDDPTKNHQAERELRGGHGFVAPENDNMPANDNISISKDQIDIALERNTRRIMEFIDNLRGEIDDLKRRIAELESRPARVIEKQMVQSSSHEPVIREPSQPAVQKSTRPAQQQSGGHARSDPNMAEDVSIEKMFYYGKK